MARSKATVAAIPTEQKRRRLSVSGMSLKLVLIAMIVTLLTPLSSATALDVSAPTSSLRVSAHQLPASGGVISVTANVGQAQTCRFFSAPKIPGLDGTVRCADGKVIRRGRVGRITGQRTVHVELVVTNATELVTKQISFHQGATPDSPEFETVYHQAGTGEATTDDFFIPPNVGSWLVDWSFNCPAVFSGFSYFVYSGNSPDINDSGPTNLNRSGDDADAFSDDGDFDLQIITNCSWDVSVLIAAPVRAVPRVTEKLSTATPVIDQAGGTATITGSIRGATWCTLISLPDVPSLDGKVRCSSGKFTKQGVVPASATPRTIEVEVVATGAAALQVSEVSIVERTPQTLLATSGTAAALFSSANATTPQFVIPESDTQWTLSWSYTCPFMIAASPVSGLFDVSVDGSTAGDETVFEEGTGGSGVEVYKDTGTFSLSVTAVECNWTVSVVG